MARWFVPQRQNCYTVVWLVSSSFTIYFSRLFTFRNHGDHCTIGIVSYCIILYFCIISLLYYCFFFHENYEEQSYSLKKHQNGPDTNFIFVWYFLIPFITDVSQLFKSNYRSSKSEIDHDTISLAETAVASEEEDSDDVRFYSIITKRFYLYFIESVLSGI